MAETPIAGREDQAGGGVWRWQDGDNYYVARANALKIDVDDAHIASAGAVGLWTKADSVTRFDGSRYGETAR